MTNQAIQDQVHVKHALKVVRFTTADSVNNAIDAVMFEGLFEAIIWTVDSIIVAYEFTRWFSVVKEFEKASVVGNIIRALLKQYKLANQPPKVHKIFF